MKDKGSPEKEEAVQLVQALEEARSALGDNERKLTLNTSLPLDPKDRFLWVVQFQGCSWKKGNAREVEAFLQGIKMGAAEMEVRTRRAAEGDM